MNIGNILVVDDEPDICALIKEILEDEGFQVTIAENGAEARAAMTTRPVLILLDIWMPDIDGITLLKEWTASGDFLIPVIMMSGHGTVETAVEATRLGAYDFLEKPLSMAKLVLTVKNAIKTSWLEGENRKLQNHGAFPIEIIGKSEAADNLRKTIDRVAGHEMPVLIIGESGTDKESVARYIHNRSSRHSSPFVGVNISALAANDQAGAIFGRYTTEGKVEPGLIDEAKDGTLFVKDVADLDFNCQAKLHDAIEKGSINRIGGGPPVPMPARIIAATRKPLDNAIREGRFRDDLFFRLSVIPIVISPLRDHFEDVPELLEYYVNYFVNMEKLPYRHFTTSAQNRLRRHSWPGNTRELKNLVQRMLILGHADSIDLAEVETALGEKSSSRADNDLLNFDLPLRDAREKFERAYLEYQLKQANGSVSKIAQTVGMERTHLYRKLKSLGIEIKN